MLIQKPPSLNDVVSIKLTNGDEVVGRFQSQDTTGVTISQPVIVAVQQTQQGLSLGFMPFMVSTDDDKPILLPTNTLLNRPTPTRADVANNYRRATGGIEVAPSGLVLPS